MVPCDDGAIERAARAIYEIERGESRESWEDYQHAVPVFAAVIIGKARAALSAAGEAR